MYVIYDNKYFDCFDNVHDVVCIFQLLITVELLTLYHMLLPHDSHHQLYFFV